ncbi:abortive infection family protein [uncultured Bacteroides sp.]|uniref:abortive infection family protein n=1 Tax=uncultured Bacteroides sp. TaxID=162156 RepID=UPI002593A90D|nr:abortive infection family protein [uncultured Bacteroides sp.]
MDKISPKYQMEIVQNINDRLYELFKSYDDVEVYVEKWREVYDEFGNANFYIQYKNNEHKKIDLKKTLHLVDGETLLKMAIDLGIETPDFIPSIPTFKNELKSSYATAAQTFEKAYRNVEKDPNLAIGLANSALESILKEILKDERLDVQYNGRDTLSKLIKNICKAFCYDTENSLPNEVQRIAQSLIGCSNAIEDLRSTKTEMHGKTQDDFIIKDPMCASFIVNAVSTVGLFLLNYYKAKYPPMDNNLPSTFTSDDLPF